MKKKMKTIFKTVLLLLLMSGTVYSAQAEEKIPNPKNGTISGLTIPRKG